MLILSVDSSATPASVCLYDDKVLALYYIHTKLTHSQTLVAMIESVLKLTGTAVEDIDLFAVNNGPGSFTGVRIGVSAVKGMAYAHNKPCVAVSTLESMAMGLLHFNGIVAACMDARRHQVYNALFRIKGQSVERLCDDRAISIDELLEELKGYSEPVLLSGDGAELVFCTEPKADHLQLAPPNTRFQNAAAVALAAVEKYQRQETVSAAALQPAYLRLSQAERERQRKEDPV